MLINNNTIRLIAALFEEYNDKSFQSFCSSDDNFSVLTDEYINELKILWSDLCYEMKKKDSLEYKKIKFFYSALFNYNECKGFIDLRCRDVDFEIISFFYNEKTRKLTEIYTKNVRKMWADMNAKIDDTDKESSLNQRDDVFCEDNKSIENSNVNAELTIQDVKKSISQDNKPLRSGAKSVSIASDDNNLDYIKVDIENDLSEVETRPLFINNFKEKLVEENDISKKDMSSIQKSSVIPVYVDNVSTINSRVSFRLPNAMVGRSYSGKVEGINRDGNAVKILDVKFMSNSDGIGLAFDVNSSTLMGEPTSVGEHKIQIKWSNGDNVSFSDDCTLIVNPDPRSLWKIVEPPADSPYFKLNTDCSHVKYKNILLLAASRRGRSHEHSGTFRDDDYFIDHDLNSGWSIIIVADGAGSAKYSRMGSQLAVNAFGGHLKSGLYGDFGNLMSKYISSWNTDSDAASMLGKEFHNIFHRSSLEALQSIEIEASRIGASIKDYSTTLLAAAVKKDGAETFIATFWLGDGAIGAFGPIDKIRLMGTPDSGEFAGQTRFLDRSSLFDKSFSKRIGIGKFADLIAVILMTDGVSDPIFETDNGLTSVTKWKTLWEEISPLIQTEDPCKELIDWLGFFSPGHHDDRTIAILC